MIAGNRWRLPAQPGGAGIAWVRRREPWVFGVLLAASFTFLMLKARGNTFFYDEWTWIVTRNSGLHSVLAAYNNHLLVAPLTLYQLLFRTVGLEHYWVYRLLGTLVHLGCASAVYVYARRRIGASALLLVASILLLGYAWEYVIWPINVGFIASIGLSICALLALDRNDGRGALLACGLLVCALACSEFTLVFAVGIGFELLSGPRRLERAYVWVLPLLLYGIWWLAYHQPSAARNNLTLAPSFALDLAASAAGGLFGLGIGWGRVLIVILALAVFRRLSLPGPLSQRAVTLLVAAVGFWLTVALGRAQFGTPTASRYIYTGAILIVLLAAEVWRGIALPPRPLVAAGIVLAISLAGNIRVLGMGESIIRRSSQTMRAELGAVALARAYVPAAFTIDAHYMPGMAAGPYFSAIDTLGSSAADSPSLIAREPELARTNADQTLMRAGALISTAAPAARLGSVGTAVPRVENLPPGRVRTSAGCVSFTPDVSGGGLDLGLPADGVRFSAAGPGESVVLARRFATGFAGPGAITLTGGRAMTLRPRQDADPAPWHLRVQASQPVEACVVGR